VLVIKDITPLLTAYRSRKKKKAHPPKGEKEIIIDAHP
jgi:hypothetical protein